MPILTTRALSSARGFGFGGGAKFLLTVSTNQSNFNLRTYALANGWNGSARLIVTINAGVTISSSSTGIPAFTVSGSFPGGVQLVNNGVIIGMGGAGGFGGYTPDNASYFSGPGGGGGTAISAATAITITNAGTFAGGGGGGGGGSIYGGFSKATGGGGGGGRSGATNSAGGAAGYAQAPFNEPASPGTAGTSSAAGTGGAGRDAQGDAYSRIGGTGGNGGGWGQAGASGACATVNGSVNCAFSSSSPGAGGAAGNSVVGNSFITWATTGTRLGPIT
jgi:hypothetical protein